MEELRVYEILYIVDPTQSEEAVQEVQDKVKKQITDSGGAIRKDSIWGKRRLAYEVKGFSDGTYLFIEFDGNEQINHSINELSRVEPRIIRLLITRVPKAYFEEQNRKMAKAAMEAEKAKKRAEEDAARQARREAAEDAARQAELDAQKEAEATKSEEPEVKPEEPTVSEEAVPSVETVSSVEATPSVTEEVSTEEPVAVTTDNSEDDSENKEG